MSTRSEAVLSALADGATTRAEIAEATGLELQAVSQELSILRGKGLADRTPEGWVVTDGTSGRKEHLQAPPEEPQKTRRKATKKTNGAGRQSTAEAKASPGSPEVAVFGEFVVMRRADAERLLELHQALQRAGYGG
jgi:DNA-binding transcriptional ArsR family regulator